MPKEAHINNKMSVFKDSYRKIGKITKAKGYKGHILAKTEPIKDPPQKGSFLFIGLGEECVPFEIEECSLLDSRQISIKFIDVNSPEEAAGLIPCELFVHDTEAESIDNDADIHQLAGFRVINTSDKQEAGSIIEVMELEHQDVFRIMDNETEYMIPAVPELIYKIDADEKEIWMEIPHGLLDIYKA